MEELSIKSIWTALCSEWAWTLWTATLPLKGADRSKPLQLAVRAIDAAYNAQPEVGDQRKLLASNLLRLEFLGSRFHCK